VPPTRVYVDADSSPAEIARFREVAEVVPVAHSDDGLDLAMVLADLHEIGVQSVLVEGGGKTLGAFLRSGLADDVVLFVASRLFGAGDATPVVDLPAVVDPEDAWRMTRSATIPLGQDVVFVGKLEAR
jgi:diaminohydroxyphosphoribosylaminopyrimidine deaminase/5-amino-6-(5-phosphoribosylamino)uracil reductase